MLSLTNDIAYKLDVINKIEYTLLPISTRKRSSLHQFRDTISKPAYSI